MLDAFEIPPTLLDQPPGVYYFLHDADRRSLSTNEESTILLAIETYSEPIDALIAALESGVFALIYDRLCQAQTHAWGLTN